MNVKELKELIADLPDDTPVVTTDRRGQTEAFIGIERRMEYSLPDGAGGRSTWWTTTGDFTYDGEPDLTDEAWRAAVLEYNLDPSQCEDVIFDDPVTRVSIELPF